MLRERLTAPSTYVALVTTVASLMVAGCGGQSTPEKPQAVRGPAAGTMPYTGLLKCMLEPGKVWEPSPRDINAPYIAEKMGSDVTPQEVLDGEWGPAHCVEGVQPAQVDSARPDIEGMSGPCLVVGLGTELKPVAGVAYHDVIADCAALGAPA